jgi:Na+/melibiose symporter-like transporter
MTTLTILPFIGTILLFCLFVFIAAIVTAFILELDDTPTIDDENMEMSFPPLLALALIPSFAVVCLLLLILYGIPMFMNGTGYTIDRKPKK